MLSAKAGNSEVIQSLWIGDALSVMEQLSISSFLKNGHEYHLYVYDEIKNIPAGTALKDAAEILPSSRIFRHKNLGTFSSFSNIFRYKLLLERGGYWADTDVVSLKKFDLEKEYVFAEEEIMKAKRITGNIIKSPPGAEIMRFCLETSMAKDPQSLYWGQIGPDLITAAVHKFGLESEVMPYGNFNPINWWHWQDFLRDDMLARSRVWWRLRAHPYSIHLWNEMWRRNGADKNRNYPRNSLYEHLKRQYL
jgi:hypothetical protein